jgi:hypothetical protein
MVTASTEIRFTSAVCIFISDAYVSYALHSSLLLWALLSHSHLPGQPWLALKIVSKGIKGLGSLHLHHILHPRTAVVCS